ncbi:MAG: TolC family protein, partial [Nitratireductor sp.]|nr:TolC family protein [Nitratireductor sp.]
MNAVARISLPALMALGLVACTGETQRYAARDAGFSNVALLADNAVSKEAVWIQDKEAARTNANRVSALVRGKTVDADTAVQVALLNNKGLQAAYADLGASAAEAWQQTLLPNPKLSIGAIGIGTPGLEAYKSIEASVGANLLAFFTRPARVSEADARFQSAQLQAIDDTLRLANETRRAWIEAVAAFETIIYLNQAQMAADAASQLAQELGQTGALSKSGQAREHVFFAELAGRKAKAKLAAQLAKEELARLMGLWGDDLQFFVPDYLPELPKTSPDIAAAESEALRNRPDLQMRKFELEAAARRYGLTDATRYVSDLELFGG